MVSVRLNVLTADDSSERAQLKKAFRNYGYSNRKQLYHQKDGEVDRDEQGCPFRLVTEVRSHKATQISNSLLAKIVHQRAEARRGP